MIKCKLGNTMIDEAVSSNNLTIEGQRESFEEFVGLLDSFPFWFNIVTP